MNEIPAGFRIEQLLRLSRQEKRQFCRRCYQWTSRVLLLTPALRVFNVSTHDLSEKGIGFYSMEEVKVGDQFVVVLQGQDMTLLCRARVQNVHWESTGKYRVGAEFHECLRVAPDQQMIPMEWLALSLHNDGFVRRAVPTWRH